MYIDKRNPEPSSLSTSTVMKANKGKDTGPEKEVRKILREIGHTGYRLNWKKAPGRPDIAYPGRKIAIFVNGCFWHRCPKCNLPLPKSHTDFWKRKFDRNMEHDIRTANELQSLGWIIVTIWECEIRNEREHVKRKLIELLDA